MISLPEMGNIRIGDIETAYEVIRRPVKHPRIELRDGGIKLILPHSCDDPEGILRRHEAWIHRKLSYIRDARREAEGISLEDRSVDELRELIEGLAAELAGRLGVEYGRISLRTMRTKWGSCSSRGNLNFNTLLRHLPDELVEYVVLHELAHLVERKHNRDYWRIVSSVNPDHERMEHLLSVYWFAINRDGGE